MATSGAFAVSGHGIKALAAPVDLAPTPSGTWVDTGLQVDLPAAGVYHLDAMVRAQLSVTGPNTNAWVLARLWDVGAAAELLESESLIYQLAIQHPAATGPVGISGNGQAPILAEYAVPGPATIRLEAARHNTAGAAGVAMVRSDVAGRTTLRWARVG